MEWASKKTSPCISIPKVLVRFGCRMVAEESHQEKLRKQARTSVKIIARIMKCKHAVHRALDIIVSRGLLNAITRDGLMRSSSCFLAFPSAVGRTMQGLLAAKLRKPKEVAIFRGPKTPADVVLV